MRSALSISNRTFIIAYRDLTNKSDIMPAYQLVFAIY